MVVSIFKKRGLDAPVFGVSHCSASLIKPIKTGEESLTDNKPRVQKEQWWFGPGTVEQSTRGPSHQSCYMQAAIFNKIFSSSPNDYDTLN